jgi:NAD(P)H-hydrate epimerase
VLTGVIAALATSNDVFEAAWGGAYLHGAAGEVLAEMVGDRGVVAGDVADVLPEVIKQVRG